MKRSFIHSCYLFFPVIGVIVVMFSCKKEVTQLPQVSTSEISEITVSAAKGGGSITFDGGDAISACGICWGLAHNPSIDANKTTDTLHVKAFTSNLKNLVSDTVYYVRAYAVNSAGTAYGNEVSFHTLKKTLPVVTTSVPVNITSGAFKVEGQIIKNGDGVISACGFCWGVKENPTLTGNKSSDTPTGNAFAVVVDGLIPDSTYYVRAYATNEIGTAYGNQFIVKTLAVAQLWALTLTAKVSSIAASTGITSDLGTEISDRGFCWGTSDNPTIANNFVSVGNGTGSFSYVIGQLSASTIYYVRAYVRNRYGIMYGITVASKTLGNTGTVTDISGNTYKYITIGDQIWMASDLKTGKYRNGDVISDFVSITSTVGTVGNYYTNQNYGKFYNWYAVNDPRNIAPVGWHVPTDADWTRLENYLGGSDVAGGKLKEAVEYWFYPNAATDQYGFKALPTGYRFADGTYAVEGFLLGYWWTATESNATEAYNRALYYLNTQSMRQSSDKRVGFAVRCVKD